LLYQAGVSNERQAAVKTFQQTGDRHKQQMQLLEK
jgi:hypothetical protein